MKAFKKSKRARMTTCRREYKIITSSYYGDAYYDEYTNYYPKYRHGYKNPIKRIMSYQVRMYKTWKHNREKQWKSNES